MSSSWQENSWWAGWADYGGPQGYPQWGAPENAGRRAVQEHLEEQFRAEGAELAAKGKGKGGYTGDPYSGSPGWSSQDWRGSSEGSPDGATRYPEHPDRPVSRGDCPADRARVWLYSLRDEPPPEGVDVEGWPRDSDTRTSRAMAAVLRYRSPEAWGLESLSAELDLPSREIWRAVAGSRSDRGQARFRCVREPGGGLLVFTCTHRDPDRVEDVPSVVRDKADGGPTVIPRPDEGRGRQRGRSVEPSGKARKASASARKKSRKAKAKAGKVVASQEAAPRVLQGQGQGGPHGAAQPKAGTGGSAPDSKGDPEGVKAKGDPEGVNPLLLDEQGNRRRRLPLGGRTREELTPDEVEFRKASNRERAQRRRRQAQGAREALAAHGLGPGGAKLEEPATPGEGSRGSEQARGPEGGLGSAEARGRSSGPSAKGTPARPRDGGCLLSDHELGGPSSGRPGRTVGDSPDGRELLAIMAEEEAKKGKGKGKDPEPEDWNSPDGAMEVQEEPAERVPPGPPAQESADERMPQADPEGATPEAGPAPAQP